MFSPPARYEDLEQSDVRVQYLWEALTNFTNGEFTVYFAPFYKVVNGSHNINSAPMAAYKRQLKLLGPKNEANGEIP